MEMGIEIGQGFINPWKLPEIIGKIPAFQWGMEYNQIDQIDIFINIKEKFDSIMVTKFHQRNLGYNFCGRNYFLWKWYLNIYIIYASGY